MVEAWEEFRGRIFAGGFGRGVDLVSSDNMFSFVVCVVEFRSLAECRRRGCEWGGYWSYSEMVVFREESSPLCDLGGRRRRQRHDWGEEKRGECVHRGGEREIISITFIRKLYKLGKIPTNDGSEMNLRYRFYPPSSSPPPARVIHSEVEQTTAGHKVEVAKPEYRSMTSRPPSSSPQCG